MSGSPTRVAAHADAGGAVTYAQSPTAGNLLLLTLQNTVSSPAPSVTSDGWTLLGAQAASWFGWSSSIALYYRIATGGDAAPTVTATAMYAVEEWSGLAGVDSGVTVQTAATNNDGTSTLSATLASVAAGDWVFTAQGAAFGGGSETLGWSAGVSGDVATFSSGSYFAATGAGVSTGGGSVTSTATASAKPYTWALISAAFTVASSSSAQTVSPSGIASGETLGTPTVTAGAVTVSPSGIASGEAFGTATVTVAGALQTVAPTGIASGEAFGTPAITAAGTTQTVSPTGISSSEAFGVPTVTGGGMLLTADLGALDGTLTLGPITRYITATAVLGESATLATPGNTGLVAWWTPADRPALVLYDTDGQTYLAHLTLARNVKFQHELSAPGSLSFDLPADDAATDLVAAKTIVKCWYRGHPRIAVQIDESTTETAVEGRAWRSWSLPGALSWLGEAAVLPEYGIGSRTSSTTRTFGVGSKTGHWYYASGDWTRAAGFRYSDDTGLKKGKPKGLSGPNPMWIAKVDPYAHAEPNAVQYFRRPFHLSKGVTAQILATGDDYLTLWLDGEEIFTPDQQQAQSWQYLAQITVALDAGDHILAAKVQNSSVDSAGNPVSFIAALLQTNSSGDPVKGAPLLVTDTWWVVSDTTPGWNRADVLWALHDEALAREVRAAQLLGLGFGTVTDSDSQYWTDVGELTADVGSSMLDVAQQFAETHMDLDVLPGPLRVNGYIRKGTDLSGSVTLRLGKDNGSLMQHTVVRTEPSSNAAIMQLRDGRWVERVDAASISSYGRSEIGLSLGSTSEDSTADEVADKQFGETAGERFSFTTQLSILDGPQPYRDFDLGDSISVPDDQGGTVKVRVMAVTADGSGESVQQWVELVRDPT